MRIKHDKKGGRGEGGRGGGGEGGRERERGEGRERGRWGGEGGRERGKGTSEKKGRTLTWLVGSSEAKELPGMHIILDICFGVFELPLPRNIKRHDQSN
jgi:hypothetical protein